ncbi:MAG: hypothetical protein WD076_01590 [Parvularculaceae bacterium]
MIGVALVAAGEDLAHETGAKPSGLSRLARAASDAVMLLCVLVFSALAIMIIAVVAPIVLAVSAVLGAVVPPKDPGQWRKTQAA